MRTTILLGAVFTAVYGDMHLECGGEEPPPYTLEFVLLQDLSGSFEKDLIIVRELYPQLLADLAESFPGARFSFTTFSDKGIAPFGTSRNNCYDTGTPLSSDQTQFLDALGVARAWDGGDVRESQLDALLKGSRQISEIDWSLSDVDSDGRPILRIMCMSTDHRWHLPGDGKQGGINATNDGTGYAGCLDQVSLRLMFLVIEGLEKDYELLIRDLRIPGTVQLIDSDSSNLIKAIKEGMEEIVCMTTPAPTTTIVPPAPTMGPPAPTISPSREPDPSHPPVQSTSTSAAPLAGGSSTLIIAAAAAVVALIAAASFGLQFQFASDGEETITHLQGEEVVDLAYREREINAPVALFLVAFFLHLKLDMIFLFRHRLSPSTSVPGRTT